MAGGVLPVEAKPRNTEREIYREAAAETELIQ